MKNIQLVYLMLAGAMMSFANLEAYSYKKYSPKKETAKSHQLEEDAWKTDTSDLY